MINTSASSCLLSCKDCPRFTFYDPLLLLFFRAHIDAYRSYLLQLPGPIVAQKVVHTETIDGSLNRMLARPSSSRPFIVRRSSHVTSLSHFTSFETSHDSDKQKLEEQRLETPRHYRLAVVKGEDVTSRPATHSACKTDTLAGSHRSRMHLPR